MRIFHKTEPQKKLITFQNATVIDGMVKAEAATNRTSDSYVIEKLVTEHYFNSDDNLASAVENNLFGNNGVVATLKAVNLMYINHPEYANKSFVEVLRFAQKLALEYPTELHISDGGVKVLSDMAKAYLESIERFADDITFTFMDADEIHELYIDEFNLFSLRRIAEATKSEEKLISENLLYYGISSIITFWNLRSAPESATLRNWKGTYMFLAAILDLCQWPDYSEYKYELSRLVKQITLDKGEKGGFNAKAEVPSQYIFMKMQILVTTKDAIILRSKKGQLDSNFTAACRVIHGPHKPLTKKPYVFLYNNENDKELQTMLEELLKEYPDEFPNPTDSYMVPILCDGHYYDNRIIWRTI